MPSFQSVVVAVATKTLTGCKKRTLLDVWSSAFTRPWREENPECFRATPNQIAHRIFNTLLRSWRSRSKAARSARGDISKSSPRGSIEHNTERFSRLHVNDGKATSPNPLSCHRQHLRRRVSRFFERSFDFARMTIRRSARFAERARHTIIRRDASPAPSSPDPQPHHEPTPACPGAPR